MAAPTVRFQDNAPGADVSTVQNVMTALHGHLIASGWTIEYADADAIGTGSAGTPAWDKAPASNTSMGVVVYRMPANDHTNRWFVWIDARYGSSTALMGYRCRGGLTHDGSGNVSDGSAELGPAIGVNTGAGFMMSVSEDFFAIVQYGFATATANGLFMVERPRTMAGVVGEGLVCLNYRSAASAVAGFSLTASGGVLRENVSSFGVLMLGSTSGTSVGVYSSSNMGSAGTKDAAGETAYPCGPYIVSSSGLFLPRSLMAFCTDDQVAGGIMPVDVDGSVREYKFTGEIISRDPFQTGSVYRTAVATE